MAQRAEIEYAGVRCGIMDQMASSLADTDHALFLDTRTLETRLRAAAGGHARCWCSTPASPRSLAGSGYNERRARMRGGGARCSASPALRDVDRRRPRSKRCPTRCAAAPATSSPRTRACCAPPSGVDAPSFGRLMNASHASLRDDYEVSMPELDPLVALLQAQPGGVRRAPDRRRLRRRLRRAVRAGPHADVAARGAGDYRRLGGRGRLLVPPEHLA